MIDALAEFDDQYAIRAGLDPKAAYRAAITNPHHIKAKRDGFRDLGRFLDSVGLMGSFARWSWKKAGFLA